MSTFLQKIPLTVNFSEFFYLVYIAFVDDDECTAGVCQNAAACTNSVGSYYCDCTGTGYEGSDCDAGKIMTIMSKCPCKIWFFVIVMEQGRIKRIIDIENRTYVITSNEFHSTSILRVNKLNIKLSRVQDSVYHMAF